MVDINTVKDILKQAKCSKEFAEIILNHNFEKDKELKQIVKKIDKYKIKNKLKNSEEKIYDEFSMCSLFGWESSSSSIIAPEIITPLFGGNSDDSIRSIQFEYDGDNFECDGTKLF